MTRTAKRENAKISRSTFVIAVIVFGLLAAGVLFSGQYFPFYSSPTNAERLNAVESQPDLDLFLRESEAKVSEIKPGLEKGIVWADPAIRRRTDLSFVYLHGFSASRRELSPVVERLAAELKANVYFTRLAAHGLKTGEAFAGVKPQDWIDDAREAMMIGRRLGRKVIVVGTSTGALLTAHLAIDDKIEFQPDAMIMVSPNFYPANRKARFISGPLGPWLARIFIGRERSFVTTNQAHADLWTSRYRSEGVASLMDLVHSVERIDFGLIKQPLLLMYTSHDKVVDVALIEKRYEEFGSSRKLLVDLPEATRHEMASDALAPEVVSSAIVVMKSFVLEQVERTTSE